MTRANRIPTYRRQRGPKGDRAFVELSGRRHYLGVFGTPESRALCARLIAEWESGGRQDSPPPQSELTIVELAARFWKWAELYYRRPDGVPTRELGNYRTTLRLLNELYGDTAAAEFGPLALKALRDKAIAPKVDDDGKTVPGACRNYANQMTNRIRRVFKWAVSEQLLPVNVHVALQTVAGLKRGRSEARETHAVKPVADEHVHAIRPFVSRQVWALVELQLLTGARSGELVILRPQDIDRTGDVWEYALEEHKTSHHGHRRTVFFGPRAQAVVGPFLLRSPTAYCFSPTEAENERRAAAHEARETPLSCGNVPGSNCARSPKRPAGERYDVHSYGRAITRACKKAGVPHWFPHQLRHASATKLRREFGVDVARVLLGHRSPAVTETYAQLDKEKAVAVAARIG